MNLCTEQVVSQSGAVMELEVSYISAEAIEFIGFEPEAALG